MTINYQELARKALILIGVIVAGLSLVNIQGLIEKYLGRVPQSISLIASNPLLILICGATIIFFAVYLFNDIVNNKLPKKKFILLAVLIILLGVGIRGNLAYNALLWQDEGETAVDSINLYETGAPRGYFKGLPINYGSVREEIDHELYKYDHSNTDSNIYHGWLTFVLSGFMYMLFGFNHFLMRLPFLILFAVSCVYILKITDVLFGKQGKYNLFKLLALLLYSINLTLITHEYQLRYYALIVTLTLMFCYHGIRLFTLNKNKNRNKIMLLVIMTLMFHTHMTLFLSLNIALFAYLFAFSNLKKYSKELILYILIQAAQIIIFFTYTNKMKYIISVLRQILTTKLALALPAGIILVLLYLILKHKTNISRHSEKIVLGLLAVAGMVTLNMTPKKIFLPVGITVANVYNGLILALIVILFVFCLKIRENKTLILLIITSFSIFAFTNLLVTYGFSTFKFRNVISMIPLLIILSIYLLIKFLGFVDFYFFKGSYEKKMIFAALFIVGLVCFITQAATVIKVEQYKGSAFIQESIDFVNRQDIQNEKVFTSYHHFPLLLYTNTNLHYIWNVNPDFLAGTTEKFYVLEQHENDLKYQWDYYFCKQRRNCVDEPHQEIGYKSLLGNCSVYEYKSGTNIYECN